MVSLLTFKLFRELPVVRLVWFSSRSTIACWRAAFIFSPHHFDNRPRHARAHRYRITVLPFFLKNIPVLRSFACDNDRKGFIT